VFKNNNVHVSNCEFPVVFVWKLVTEVLLLEFDVVYFFGVELGIHLELFKADEAVFVGVYLVEHTLGELHYQLCVLQQPVQLVSLLVSVLGGPSLEVFLQVLELI